MTVAQIQNLQAFLIQEMSDVIDPSKHVTPDPEHKQSGDIAHVLIKTPYNQYKMSVRSTYIEPPAGAPLECRSLGTVTFDDFAGNKHVIGPKSDQTYAEISKHVHVREYTDAIAVARREMAEASPEMVSAARVRLVGLAERGVKWGIKVHVPDAPPTQAVFPQTPAGLSAPVERLPQRDVPFADLMGSRAVTHHGAPIRQVDDVSPPSTDSSFSSALMAALSKNPYRSEAVGQVDDGPKEIDPPKLLRPIAMMPWLGCPIVFVTNPGEQVSGMSEIPGWVVKVHSQDRVSIFITPDNSEVSFRDNLPRRGSSAGNGRMHAYGCWDFNQEYLRIVNAVLWSEGHINRLDKRCHDIEAKVEELGSPTVTPEVMSHDSQDMLLKLEARIDKITEEYSQVRSAFSALARRVGALEGQRKGGPKPKPKSVEPPPAPAAA